MIKILELFAGSQSFSKVAKDLNCTVFTSDIKDLQGVDYAIDILNFDVDRVPFIPDVIWASPDCAVWSKAAGAIHFSAKTLNAKTEKAKTAFLHIEKMMQVINYFIGKNPNLLYYIENPEGRLQWHIQASTLYNQKQRLVVLDQCQYGREFQKTTHIFTNDFIWTPRERCPGRPTCKHTANIKSEKKGQRSSLGALDGKRYYLRAMIPHALCAEIINLNLLKYNDQKLKSA